MAFNCLTCKISFSDGEFHRMHYKSEWHKYNLKRKIIELPSVSEKEFEVKKEVYSQNALLASTESKLICYPCRKNFISKNSLECHMQSKKHIDVVAKKAFDSVLKGKKDFKNFVYSSSVLPDEREETVVICKSDPDGVEIELPDNDDDWESVDEDEEIKMASTICLFCNHSSKTLETNIKHMKRYHSFYIPDMEYVIDLEGLLTYLWEKISEGFTCLWCNACKYSKHAIQQHIRDKGHCKMLFDEDSVALEYSDFYDYTTSYSSNDDVNTALLEEDNYQLVLPSGAVIGHRALALYYRQNVPYRVPALSKVSRKKIGYGQHSVLSWVNGGSKAAVYRAKGVGRWRLQRIQRRSLNLAVKQNKFQPHFRHQVMC